MQVSVETTSGLERRLTIAIPAEKVQSEIDKRIQKVAPQVKIDGFRAGKVPVSVVRQRFGESIRQEVLGDMMSSSFQDAVIQEKLKPAGQPTVELKKADPGKDFAFTATFEIYPEFKVIDLKGVSIERPQTEVTDSDVADMIETLRKQAGTFQESDKAAAEGDQVNIDFEGFKDGVAFEGGSSQGSDLVIGSKSMIPGFEDGLIGLKAGDTKDLQVTFPEEYHNENLKGAPVVFKVKVNSVKEKVLPEVDAAFMEKFGIKDGNIDSFKAEVKKNMERELKQALKHRVKQQVLDAALEKNSIDVPKSLLSQEIDVMRKQMFQQFGGGAQLPDLDANLLPAELFSEQASRRVSLGLLLNQLIADKNIKAEADRVREMIEEIASSYESKQEVIDYYYKNRQQLAQVEAVVLEDLAVEHLLDSADISDVITSYEELMKSIGSR